MTPDEARELLGAYAVDAVDDDERRAVEELVASDPAAAAELAELHATAATLGAATATAPPAHVRDAVLASLATTPQDGRVVDLAQQRDRRREQRARRPLPLGWAAAAAVAVVLAAGVPGTLAWQQHERAVGAEERADLLADVLADSGATLLRDAVAGGGEAVAVLTDERAVVVTQDLPGLDDDRVYQAWAMRDGVPVAAGLLDVRDGAAAHVLDDYRPGDGVALSVEPAGGSQQPTTTPVVVLLPQA